MRQRLRWQLLAVGVGVLAVATLAARSQGGVTPPATPPRLAPFVPTPQNVVERMLKLAGVTKRDVVYDLGCGDGRVVITAAREFGARGVGIDIDPQRIEESENLTLRPLLTKQLRPGARVVSHAFDLGDWEPAKVERFADEMGITRTLYL